MLSFNVCCVCPEQTGSVALREGRDLLVTLTEFTAQESFLMCSSRLQLGFPEHWLCGEGEVGGVWAGRGVAAPWQGRLHMWGRAGGLVGVAGVVLGWLWSSSPMQGLCPSLHPSLPVPGLEPRWEQSPALPSAQGPSKTCLFLIQILFAMGWGRASAAARSPRCARHADVSLLVSQGYFKFVYLDGIRWFGCWHSILAWQSSKYVYMYLYLAFFSGMFS